MDFDWTAYRGDYLLVSLVSPPDLEVDEVLGDKHTLDSANRYVNYVVPCARRLRERRSHLPTLDARVD